MQASEHRGLDILPGRFEAYHKQPDNHLAQSPLADQYRICYYRQVTEIQIAEYVDAFGRSAFARWFDHLDATAAARVTIALTRLSLGNFSNVEGVGAGVFELKIDFGPGYRIYFGKDGERIVILLGGSTKKRQSAAIASAQSAWIDYRRRKWSKE